MTSIKKFIIVVIIINIFFCCKSNIPEGGDNIKKKNNLEIFIEKTDNKKEKRFLRKFKRKFSKDDRFDIEELNDYYKIIVSHQHGGAECYHIDKKTGEINMIWHEHPEPKE